MYPERWIELHKSGITFQDLGRQDHKSHDYHKPNNAMKDCMCFLCNISCHYTRELKTIVSDSFYFY